MQESIHTLETKIPICTSSYYFKCNVVFTNIMEVTGPSPDVCLVTAFLDIGRDEWNTYSRSVSEYFTSFLPYLRLHHDIIVFMDDRHSLNLQSLISKCSPSARVKIVPINREWMKDHIFAYSKLKMETLIMNSDGFKQLIPDYRKGCPETYSPEYNIMQHAKIDFVCHAIDANYSQCRYFAWTDFGYFKNDSMTMDTAKTKLDITKFDLEKVNFQTINPVDERDRNVMYTLTYAPEKIGGFFYFGGIEPLKEYQKIYHDVYSEMHRMGIVDDDQHMMIRSYFRNKSLFRLWDLGGWHKIYTTFCV